MQRMQFHNAAGRNFNDVTVATVVFDANGQFVTGGEKLERLSHSGFVAKSTLDLTPGKYLMRPVARDSEGAHMAARNGIVVIPN
ncbi:MAG: hypothetical protein WBW14_22545 [Candidatus Acidiferrum sp.]